MLYSEHAQGPQVEFFLKEMEGLKRDVTPWVIVHMHRRAVPRIPHTLLGDVCAQAALFLVSQGHT